MVEVNVVALPPICRSHYQYGVPNKDRWVCWHGGRVCNADLGSGRYACLLFNEQVDLSQ